MSECSRRFVASGTSRRFVCGLVTGPKGTWRRILHGSTVWLAWCGLVAPPSLAQVQQDDFLGRLAGSWTGSGEYEGAMLRLARVWSPDLGGSFLRGEMTVTMANGASFEARTYWRVEPDGYRVLWMDATGRMQELDIRASDAGNAVATEFLDELTGEAPETRRWEFELVGDDRYVERLYREVEGTWQLLATWQFERDRSP